MKTYKQIDFWGSIILISGFIIASFIRMDATFIIGYFVVGAWQLVSIIVHGVKRWFTRKGSSRLFYQHLIIVLACALTGAFVIFLTAHEVGGIFLMVILFALLITAPFLAISYTIICYNELFVAIPKRELAHLK
jgi:hypothetical protein